MTKGSNLVVEISSNGGVTWKKVGNTISGVSDRYPDKSISSAAFTLPKSAKPIRIRFRYFSSPLASIYPKDQYPTSPTGIFIDDITTANCEWLAPMKIKTLKAKSTKFEFNAKSAGASLVEGSKWAIRIRTKLGNKWFPGGPLKTVTIKAP